MAVKFSVSNKSRHKGRNIYIRFPAKFLFYLGVMQIRNTHPYIKPIEDRYLASILKQSLPFSLKISLFQIVSVQYLAFVIYIENLTPSNWETLDHYSLCLQSHNVILFLSSFSFRINRIDFFSLHACLQTIPFFHDHETPLKFFTLECRLFFNSKPGNLNN